MKAFAATLVSLVLVAGAQGACVGPFAPSPPAVAPRARAAAAPTPSNPPPGAVAPKTLAPGAFDEVHDPAQWFASPARGASSPTGLVDLSELNATPAGAGGFIRARGGHFVDGSGQRVRFFGVNCTATACFPAPEVATRAAAHLRRLGVNVVRFHFLDNGPPPTGLLMPRNAQGPEPAQLEPAQLERLDFFVAELAKNGIYANLNLHVARRYPGLDAATARRFQFGKLLDRFYPPFIEEQKKYARALLTHVNPHTGRPYAAEPAVLCVEMNNENTALPFWAGSLDDLPEPFGGELRRQWNAWLRARYKTTVRLLTAWTGTGKTGAAELLEGADLAQGTKGWVFESAGVPTRGEVVTTETGGRALRFSAERRGTASWHLQLYRAHLPLREGESYRLGFRVRAPANVAGTAGPIPPARNLEVTAMLSVPDWRNIGLGRTIALGPDWQRVELSFRPQGTIDGEGRINFSLRNVPGVLEIADLSLRPGAVPSTLGANETVEGGTVPLVRGQTGSPAGEDFLRFLADTDRATAQTLAAFVRKQLGLRSLLSDTQASYGGLEGLRRELAVSDFIDMHAYWQHPDFPSGWSPLRFSIPNTTQAAATDGGALATLAAYRVGGKPFTVSEYGVPSPNDFAAESLPMYAAIAAFQDWDAIYAYTYLDFSPAWDADHLLGFFDVAGHPAHLSFLPVAALAFRRPLIAPGTSVAQLRLPLDDGRTPPQIVEGTLPRLWAASGTPMSRIADTRFEVVGTDAQRGTDARRGTDAQRGADAKRAAARASGGEPGEVAWTPETARFTVVAPQVRIAAGRIAGQTLELGDVRVALGELPRGDAAIALVALDGLSLETSKRMLLVAAARVENTAMRFSDAYRMELASWGRGPALAEYVPVTVTLPGGGLRVRRLDPAGAPAADVPVVTADDGRARVRLERQPALWFLLER